MMDKLTHRLRLTISAKTNSIIVLTYFIKSLKIINFTLYFSIDQVFNTGVFIINL